VAHHGEELALGFVGGFGGDFGGAQCVLCLVAPGDVLDETLIVEDPAGVVADGAGMLLNPDGCAVFAPDLVFEPADLPVARHEALELIAHRGIDIDGA